ncbi:hypothetical protein QBC32DRAFT_239224 [Pseudoneurospora amorphoporcata]|uniref:Uncharacterized protein n=1 Tax=Pseudoneurospora amorphoporcata TaxID=241081 RepID=A0AAN6NUS0_9PEZI|nr:hypothetical protein QBC32DRAFT_239224 [Pseudoneurospora amorphoporcata]
MEYSSSGSRPCEQIPLSRRLSQFFKMNWTDGTLYRHSRGKLRKANADKQRQKEYFAKAKIRAAEQREAMKNGPPPISYLQSSSALPKLPPGTILTEKKSPHSASHRRGRWGASVPTAEDSAKSELLLPTVDQFLKEQVGEATAIDTAPSQSHTNAKEVERLRQRLLGSKDWGASWIRSPVKVIKRPHLVPEHAGLTQPTRATKEKTAHILQSNWGMYPQQHTSRLRSLSRADVQIRVGSQEKQLEESSTIGSRSFAHVKQDVPIERSRHFMKSSSDCETGDMPPRKRARRQPSSNAKDYHLRQAISRRHTDSDDTHHTMTSVPSIFHPVPVRAIPDHLLLSSGTLDSENIASHVAQVGRTISYVTPSQKAENSIWRAWLGESSSAPGAQTNPEQHEPMAQPRISPGVSERQEVRYEEYSPPAQALHACENDMALPEMQLSSTGTHSDVLGKYDRPVDKIGHLAPSPTQTRLSVLLETSSVDVEKTMKKRGRRIPAISHQPVSASGEPTRELHQGDPIDAWKTFVFGGEHSEEVERDAFNEARHDAAQNIRPYDENSLPSMGDDDHSGHGSNIAVAGTSSSANAELPQPYGRDMVIQPFFHSHRKIDKPSSASSQPDSASAEELVVIPHYTPLANSQSSVAVEPLGLDTSPISNEPETTENMTIAMLDAPGESTSVAASATTSADASLVAEPAQSRSGAPDSGEQFRFAPPRPFVGKHSVPSRNDRPSVAIAPATLKRKRGRPRKRACDGRADIRALPNYSGDPIEEIEDGDNAPQPSLFGSLDVCYDQ